MQPRGVACSIFVLSQILFQGCKPSTTTSQIDDFGLEQSINLCAADGYSPLEEYLDEHEASNSIVPEELQAAFDESDGYLAQCSSLDEKEASASLSLSGASTLLRIIAVKAGREGVRLLRSPVTGRIIKTHMPSPATLKGAVSRTMIEPLVEGKYTHIYNGAAILKPVSFNPGANFAQQAFSLSSQKLTSHLSGDMAMLANFLKKLKKADIRSAKDLKEFKKEMSYFSDMRKRYKTSRFSFQAFDSTAMSPKVSEKLTVIIGHLNDAYDNSAVKSFNQDVDKLQTMFSKKDVEKEIALELERFSAKDSMQLKLWVKAQVAFLESHMVPGKELFAPEYHEVRKTAQRLVTIIDSARQVLKTEEFDDVLRVLSSINGKMGAVQDALTTSRVTIGTASYNNAKVIISDDVLKLIKNFVTNFKISL